MESMQTLVKTLQRCQYPCRHGGSWREEEEAEGPLGGQGQGMPLGVGAWTLSPRGRVGMKASCLAPLKLLLLLLLLLAAIGCLLLMPLGLPLWLACLL